MFLEILERLQKGGPGSGRPKGATARSDNGKRDGEKEKSDPAKDARSMESAKNGMHDDAMRTAQTLEQNGNIAAADRTRTAAMAQKEAASAYGAAAAHFENGNVSAGKSALAHADSLSDHANHLLIHSE